MNLKKYLFCFALTCISCYAFSQVKDSTVFLKWKLKPGEVLGYKTEMREIDTANHQDFDMSGLWGSIHGKDTSKLADLRKIMSKLNKEIHNFEMVTQLTEKHKGVITVEMMAVNNEKGIPEIKAKNAQDSLKNIGKLLSMLTTGVKLRGSVNEDGSIQSFYTKNDQRNLLSIFFELPAKNIKVGDTWALDVHLLSADEHFECDSAYKKNQVTFVALENINGEHIATLKYDILEYMQGTFRMPMGEGAQQLMMRMSHKAIARFSIEKGRWVFYEGVMSLSSSGMMKSKSTKKLSLVAN